MLGSPLCPTARSIKKKKKKTTATEPGVKKNLPFSYILSSSLPSALVAALLPEFAANDSILATCEMTKDKMQIMFVYFNLSNTNAWFKNKNTL